MLCVAIIIALVSDNQGKPRIVSSLISIHLRPRHLLRATLAPQQNRLRNRLACSDYECNSSRNAKRPTSLPGRGLYPLFSVTVHLDDSTSCISRPQGWGGSGTAAIMMQCSRDGGTTSLLPFLLPHHSCAECRTSDLHFTTQFLM